MDYLPWVLVLMIVINPHLILASSSQSTLLGFSTKLILRDSPLAPLYDHSLTRSELLRKAAQQSLARSSFFSSYSLTDSNIVSNVFPNNGAYMMQISVGSPPVQFYAFADTGSDLVWLQCKPCISCYPQDQQPFDPQKSSTFRELLCLSIPCLQLPSKTCSGILKCAYNYAYGDGSRTTGILSRDTFTFNGTDGNPVSFPGSIFGCGHSNSGNFDEKVSGLVGLGGGPLSLISQLGTRIGYKFSYCLVPYFAVSSSSKLKFGSDAVLVGNNVVSTPLVSKIPSTFYYLTLEGATVGNTTIPNNNVRGNIIIDSGTTLTMLGRSFYTKLEDSVKNTIGLSTVPDPDGTFTLCYDNDSFSHSRSVPSIVFHFTGADIAFNIINTFLPLERITCFAMQPTDEQSIFGNIAQANFQVAYDLGAKKVSFAPAGCSTLH